MPNEKTGFILTGLVSQKGNAMPPGPFSGSPTDAPSLMDQLALQQALQGQGGFGGGGGPMAPQIGLSPQFQGGGFVPQPQPIGDMASSLGNVAGSFFAPSQPQFAPSSGKGGDGFGGGMGFGGDGGFGIGGDAGGGFAPGGGSGGGGFAPGGGPGPSGGGGGTGGPGPGPGPAPGPGAPTGIAPAGQVGVGQLGGLTEGAPSSGVVGPTSDAWGGMGVPAGIANVGNPTGGFDTESGPFGGTGGAGGLAASPGTVGPANAGPGEGDGDGGGGGGGGGGK